VRVRGGHGLLHGNLHSWREIARGGLLGIQMRWLGVRGNLGCMGFESMLGDTSGGYLKETILLAAGDVPIV
jgi:hypothetical protein